MVCVILKGTVCKIDPDLVFLYWKKLNTQLINMLINMLAAQDHSFALPTFRVVLINL